MKNTFILKAIRTMSIFTLTLLFAVGLTMSMPRVASAEAGQIVELVPTAEMNAASEETAYILETYRIYSQGGNIYINDINTGYRSNFMYIMLQGSGGAGGDDIDNNKKGYGGGSGAFVIYRVEISRSTVIVATGEGGTYNREGFDEINQLGDGIYSYLAMLIPYTFDGVKSMYLAGGDHGTTNAPGIGGVIIPETTQGDSSFYREIAVRPGLDGGVASAALNVTFSEPGYSPYNLSYPYQISGFAWSGIGGAASPLSKGGDGGVWMNAGQNAGYGAGGGGVGLSGTNAGLGGDAHVRFFVGS